MSMGTIITAISARPAYSNRGTPAVEVTVQTANGTVGKALSCCGTSIGRDEAACLFDGGEAFDGRGVTRAAKQVNTILAPALIGQDALLQSACDSLILELGKEKLGANATASVSSAILKTAAKAAGMELFERIGGTSAFMMPVPAHNAATGCMRYGGKVSAGNKPTYSFVSYGFDTYDEAAYALWELVMDWADFMTAHLGIKVMIDNGFNIPKNRLSSDEELWKMMSDMIERHHMAGRIGIQVDVGASGFFNRKTGMYEGIFSPEPKTREDMIELICDMPRKYPFVIIEDPLDCDDFDGFSQITSRTGIQIVGDDLFATNHDRLMEGIRKKAANCILISPAQIGTVTEAFQLAVLARENGYGITVSGSRGEEVDICDYAVGLCCGTVRECGLSFSGNRLMKIQEIIGRRARFYGRYGISGAIGQRHP